MENFIAISTLNDFIFCPYSIYLHNVYMESDETIYYATPQVRGKIAHEGVDKKTYSTKKDDIMSLPICSEKYGLIGKIDLLKKKEHLLIERKYQLKQIFQGQIYQLWAQYFCLVEMGFQVDKLAFYEISTNKMIPVELPNDEQVEEFEKFIQSFKNFDPAQPLTVSPKKCEHCIYNNLCDKAEVTSVYA